MIFASCLAWACELELELGSFRGVTCSLGWARGPINFTNLRKTGLAQPDLTTLELPSLARPLVQHHGHYGLHFTTSRATKLSMLAREKS